MPIGLMIGELVDSVVMDPWGIEHSYLDSEGIEHRVVPETVRALRELIGTPAQRSGHGPIVTRPGARVDAVGEVRLEDGGGLRLDGSAPVDLPLGYHVLVGEDGCERSLIVSPGRCHQPGGRAWGWAVQLYAARSRQSWGMGDLGDLRALAERAGAPGAGFLLVNPLTPWPWARRRSPARTSRPAGGSATRCTCGSRPSRVRSRRIGRRRRVRARS